MLELLRQNKTLILLTIVILGIPAILFTTTLSMVEIWNTDGSYGHGYLIFPISIWLIYQQRKKVNSYALKPEPRALLLFLIITFLWLIAKVVDVQLVQQLSLIALTLTSILVIFGHALFVSLCFPLFFLFLAVPMGQSLIQPMMELTADFTVAAVKLIGIPIYRDGLLFSLPSGNWSVVEACSGVRYIIASFTLGTLYAYITYSSNFKRVSFVVIAVIVSAIANGLRAFGIVLIGHYSKMQYGTGGDHTFYGWIFYGIVIALLFYVGSIWADTQKSENDKELMQTTPNKSKKSIAVMTGLVVGSLVVVQVLASGIVNNSYQEADNIAFKAPQNYDAWQMTNDRDLGWQPQIRNPKAHITKTYQYGSDLVQVSLGYFPNQQQGSEAISSENKLTTHSGRWKQANSVDLQLENFYVRETELKYGDRKLLVWNWYLVGENETPNQYIAKIINVINVMVYQRNDASYMTLATPLLENTEDSRQILGDFMREAHLPLVNALTRLTTQ
ncbi:MAG: exosortase A [Oleiphilaceae bacterium]|jgi:exosortase A